MQKVYIHISATPVCHTSAMKRCLHSIYRSEQELGVALLRLLVFSFYRLFSKKMAGFSLTRCGLVPSHTQVVVSPAVWRHLSLQSLVNNVILWKAFGLQKNPGKGGSSKQAVITAMAMPMSGIRKRNSFWTAFAKKHCVVFTLFWQTVQPRHNELSRRW